MAYKESYNSSRLIVLEDEDNGQVMKRIRPIHTGKQEENFVHAKDELDSIPFKLNKPHRSFGDVDNMTPSPTVHINKADNTEWLVHKVNGRETLQGLALKYGVEVSDIKKINKLWGNEDIFARKEIYIPTTMEHFQSIAKQHPQTGLKEKNLDLTKNFDQKKPDIIKQFVEITHCEEKVAQHYLEEKNYNFTKALGSYFTEQENKPVKENGIVTPKVALDDLEIWTDEEGKAKQIREFNELNIHAINGPRDLAEVKKSVQARFEQDDEQMFNL